MKKLLAASAAVLVLAAAVPVLAQSVERREIGNQILENVPVAPPAIRESLARYQNARSAAFDDWAAGGGMIIATRFGNTNQLHVVAAPGADRSQITFYDEPVSSAHTLPDGKILFSKDTGGDEWFQLFVRDADGKVVQLTQPGTRNQSPAWSKDGSVLVWSRAVKGSADYDVLMRDPAAPDGTKVIYKGQGQVSPIAVSPDGKAVLLGRYLSINESRYWLLDVATGKLTELSPGKKVAYSGGIFTPDGKSILTLSDEGSDFARLVQIDLATGAKLSLSGERPWDVEDFALSDDGRILAYVVNEDGYSKLVVQDFRTRRALPQPELPAGVVSDIAFSPDGSKLGFSLATPTAASDAWSWGVTDAKLERWTASELGGLDAKALTAPELVRFPSFDKRSIPAFVYKPKRAAGARAPVIIDIHGGPEGQSRPTFNAFHQHTVAELGAAVIVTNVRGSTGYGKTYLNLDNAEKREDSVKDIGALLDWIKTQPDLDSNRVVVYGQSYGGYMSLAVMTRYSDRLAGGIERYGISNFVSFLQNTEAYRRDLRRAEYGDERDPKMLKAFETISPMNNVSKITKPMLVMQGWNDPRVPKSESDQVVAKLRGQGVETWYVQFKDEGHGFLKKANNDRRREVETQFLRKVLGLDGAK
ncbi:MULTISPECIES: S9 family peptidase [unclassified Caulobacter]|uniref:S9 family peptidase n=1 Tax=unclassified Caulobacter TaxID=2648921 RepID=UPI0006FCA44E|nr:MULTISPECIES: S9 family peptidase [unclassified Caulobacter]KQV62874.1 peptidase S9 [Caulobacter sp. Root342]KQV65632.1 peptidase S9 [Caulobacter sp. Root343]